MSSTNWQPGMTLEDIEKNVILKAFEYYKGNKQTTSMSLGISARTLETKLAAYKAAPEAIKGAEAAMKRKIESSMIHFFGSKERVALTLGMTVEQVSKKLVEYAMENGNGLQANGGLRVQPAAEVSEKPPVSVREPGEVQNVLPRQAAQSSKSVSR